MKRMKTRAFISLLSSKWKAKRI